MPSDINELDPNVMRCLLYGYAHAKRELDAALGANHRNRTPASALLAENLRILVAESMILNYVGLVGVPAALTDVCERYVEHVVRMLDAGLTRDEIDQLVISQRQVVEGFMPTPVASPAADLPPSFAAPRADVVRFPQSPQWTAGSGQAGTPAEESMPAAPEPPDPAGSSRRGRVIRMRQ